MTGLAPITFVEPRSYPSYAADAPALDSYGRRIDYLRVSLTDRCNMRCVYCMPAVGMKFLPRPELLTNEELVTVLRAAAAAGFRKIRLTGGEPMLRYEIVELVRAIKSIPGIEHIAMTTNALRLGKLAGPLKEAGLDRVNISIDSLDPQKFRQITRGGSLDDVWAGVRAADEVGLRPIKLNAVVVRGMNDDEVIRLAALTTEHPWEFRFIEVMPLTGVAGLAEEGVISTAELVARISAHFGPLEPYGQDPSDPARRYRIPGAPGKLGFISAVTDPFCATCNRMRLTAEGRLHLCLLRDDELDLRAAVRSGAGQDEIEQLIRHAVYVKPWGHGLPEGVLPTLRGMSQLGG
ncbi:GTP 3',8-cyclase MoaA [Oscillochloris sp. ZM17-4]|uniref:GTP 3',8-cyclase MoaA n=1 Tax=Oscillochloris sp. ZM17-4 TaxID=2866714 RepID=UPI00351DA7EE